MKDKVKKAAFAELLKMKEQHSKIKEGKYDKFQTQPCLKSSQLSNKEKTFIYRLRSKCHQSKMNFKRRFRNNFQCTFGCQTDETQVHTLTLLVNTPVTEILYHKKIFSNIDDQRDVIKHS